MLRVLEGQLSLTQVSLIQRIIILPLAMQIVLAVPKMSLWVLRRCQLLTWWEIEFTLGKGGGSFLVVAANNKGWKEKGKKIHPVMWVFLRWPLCVYSMGIFILISLNLAFFCLLYFYCLLLAELLKVPEIILCICVSASNLPPNCRTCGSKSTGFQLSQISAEGKVLILVRPLGNVLRKETPVDCARV